MQEQQQQGWTPIRDARVAANLGLTVIYALAAPMEVILRRRFGKRYLGIPSALGFLALLLWPLLFPRDDPTPVLWFTGFFLIMQLRARIESALMVVRGDLEHSRYNGWPRLASIFKRMPERRIKGVVEPIVTILAGLVILEDTLPLGTYLIVAGIALVLTADHIDSMERHKVAEMHDAWIEQQLLTNRFRQTLRDRYR